MECSAEKARVVYTQSLDDLMLTATPGSMPEDICGVMGAQKPQAVQLQAQKTQAVQLSTLLEFKRRHNRLTTG